MSSDNVTFCDQINEGGRVIEHAGMDDLHRLVDRIRRSRKCSFSLARTSDMDSGIEFIGALDGTAIFGCEDSLRGNFGFWYCDPTKAAKLLTIGIHELPTYAVCDNLENAIQIAGLFFREGELDRRFTWMVDVGVGNSVKRGNLIAAGNQLPIEVFVARVAQEQSA